ncbi:STAS domain-containing protein [Streptacidiphilus cavernicola]|uniref:STAS domain-containing protein n=1 Tax=Streptacidiphilus cavernicola TaxID=3342716 RepID=A0ABV6VQ86_9ACTN
MIRVCVDMSCCSVHAGSVCSAAQGATFMSPSDGVGETGAARGAASGGGRAVRAVEQLQVRADSGGGRTRVTAVGEIDYDSAPVLKAALIRALECCGCLLEIDLSGVSFCDCAGLNVLLQVRGRAEDRGVTVALARVGPALWRLLTLTESSGLFRLIEPVLVARARRWPLRSWARYRPPRSA